MDEKSILNTIGINYYKPKPISFSKKECSVCNEVKSLKEFNHNSKYEDGYHPWCKKCTIHISEDRKIQKWFAKPTWISEDQEEEIARLEKEAKEKSKSTGEQYSVCHIEPIQHWLICGLDLPVNLYVDSQKKNIKNSNYFLPYESLLDGKIESIDIPLEFIIDAYKYNREFNTRRNRKYRDLHRN